MCYSELDEGTGRRRTDESSGSLRQDPSQPRSNIAGRRERQRQQRASCGADFSASSVASRATFFGELRFVVREPLLQLAPDLLGACDLFGWSPLRSLLLRHIRPPSTRGSARCSPEYRVALAS